MNTEHNVSLLTSPFSLNRAARRQMKKAIKLPRTPSRQEAANLILGGYEKSEEPAKVNIPRAFDSERVVEGLHE